MSEKFCPTPLEEDVKWLRWQADMYMPGDDKMAYRLRHIADTLEGLEAEQVDCLRLMGYRIPWNPEAGEDPPPSLPKAFERAVAVMRVAADYRVAQAKVVPSEITPSHGGRPMTLRECAEAEEPTIDKLQKAELIFESEHHRNEVRKHFEWLLKKYTAADFRNTNTEAGCIWNDAVNLARGIQAEQSATAAQPDWHGLLFLRWCEWTGGHITKDDFVSLVHDIVTEHLLTPDRSRYVLPKS